MRSVLCVPYAAKSGHFYTFHQQSEDILAVCGLLFYG